MDREITIKTTVSVSDGSFEASLIMPVSATEDQMKAIVRGWMDALTECYQTFPEVEV